MWSYWDNLRQNESILSKLNLQFNLLWKRTHIYIHTVHRDTHSHFFHILKYIFFANKSNEYSKVLSASKKRKWCFQEIACLQSYDGISNMAAHFFPPSFCLVSFSFAAVSSLLYSNHQSVILLFDSLFLSLWITSIVELHRFHTPNFHEGFHGWWVNLLSMLFSCLISICFSSELLNYLFGRDP